MANLKNLTKKTVKTLQEDGLSGVAQKASLYVKRRKEEKAESRYADFCFRDVLFINGCDEHLPHPGRYRVTHQREQLESLGLTTGEVYYQYLQQDTVRCYRSFIFFRCPWTEEIDRFVTVAKALNKPVLYDVDDLVVDTFYTDMIRYLDTMDKAERAAYDENVRCMGRLLKLCDGAITTTSCLAQELEHYVPQVCLNRNTASIQMVQLSEEALQRADRDETSVKLGYFSGSITHDDDMAIILPVLLELMEEYPELQLHIVGELDLPHQLEERRKQVVVHPFTDWKKLPELIASVDINLAPLTNNTFNRAKSENKWMEAALVKVPTVASDIGAFHEMVENGVTGILCRDLIQWKQALAALITQPEYRSLIGERAYHFCRQECVTVNTGIELYRFLHRLQNKNICFILPGFQVSGGVMVALQHCCILQRAGWDVTLISISDTEENRWYEFGGCRFPVLAFSKTVFAGCIHRCVATMWSTVDPMKLISGIEKRLYLVQNYEPEFYGPEDPLRLRARSTYGDQVNLNYITISEWCQQWLWEQYGHVSGRARNGIDLSQFESRRRTPGEKVRILIEGDSSAEHKNVDESFSIAALLDPQRYEIWYLAYHGEPKEWYRVDRFLSAVPYDRVQEVYSSCDILLKSSVLESFSYPPLEMMATGGYVVAVQNGGNAEYLRDGENCLIYPLGDIEAGAERIREICRDSRLQERLYQNGLKTASDRTWEKAGREILSLYQ